MEHRHLFSSSQNIEAGNDQGWNHPEQAYMHQARAGGSAGITSVYPVENLVIDGGNFASQRNPAPRLGGYLSAAPNVQVPHYQPQASGPSHDQFFHPSAAGGFPIVQDTYSHHASSSNHGGQTFHGVDGGAYDFTGVSGRGSFKRKSPSLPSVWESGSASRYHEGGSSSGVSMPIDAWHEKQISEFHQAHWDFPPSYNGHSLTIHNGDTPRNVRSRAAFELETDPARIHLSTNPHNSFTTFPADHSSSANLWGQSPNGLAGEWNPSLVNPAGHGRPFTQGNSSQSVRGVRTNYTQRSTPTFRASSSNLRPGHAVPSSDVGLQAVAERYAARHSPVFTNVALRDRSARSRIGSDRYRSFPDEVVVHDQLTPEGLMIAGRSAFHGSRGLFDHHRDMRLDIDNMSYEDLLALEERIGIVNTGLSDDLISKCLTHSVFWSPDQFHEEEKCVICLEEYKDMDNVGSLKICSHDFHVECISKWLSMKSVCPICKASAIDEKMKQN